MRVYESPLENLKRSDDQIYNGNPYTSKTMSS